jgi:hypothetical protein
MKKQFGDRAFVGQNLDKIGRAGEDLGAFLKSLVGNTKRLMLVIGALAGLGLIVFVWAMVRGARKRK